MAREMKNSGVQWIGDIPRGWNVAKFKHWAQLYNGDSISDNEKEKYEDADDAISYIPTRAIDTTTHAIDYNDGMYVKLTDYSFSRAQSGDVLMCIEGGSAGKKKGFLDREVAFGNKLCCFHCKKDILSKFIFYTLCSKGFEDDFVSRIQGLIGGVSINSLKNFAFCYPSIAEQRAIADFLDAKCADIDGLLADLDQGVKTLADYKKSLIAEIVTHGLNSAAPMKQSGIPWADTIPSHWKIQKGKYTFTLLQRPVKEDDGVITCFRDGEVTLRSNRREDGFTMSEKEYGYQGIEPGDLVVHGMDGFAGSIGISDSRGKGTPVLNVLDSDQNKRYLMYYLRNMAYGNVFLAMSTGIRVRSCDLSWKKLGEIRIVLPPVEEQEQIADYIDKKLEAIQEAITTKQDQIEKLKAYKASLIYEYVTGKKQVAL